MSSSSGPEAHPTAVPRSAHRRPLASLAVGLIASLLAVVAPSGAPAASAATGSCRAVSGAPAASGGPQRATVVVDTGSGPVWSACISFAGAISGVQALELAEAQIPGLAPVYDVYAGEGRAVCRLRGVGNDPPDCLGKTVDYWGYFRNGRYSSAGAGAVTVRDGDVEAWRWGSSGATPRPATQGYEAAAYVAPPTTAPPTTRPTPPPTTAAPPVGGPPATVATTAPQAGQPADPGPSTTTTSAPAAGAGPSGSSTTVVRAGGPPSTIRQEAARGREPRAQASGDGELAAAPGSPGGPSLADDDASSNAGSVVAFAAALAAVGAAGLVVRRRRNSAV